MSEDRSRRVAPQVEQRYQALAVNGELRCPLCTRAVKLPASGNVTLRVFDEFGGHLMRHQQIEFVEYIAELERASQPKRLVPIPPFLSREEQTAEIEQLEREVAEYEKRGES